RCASHVCLPVGASARYLCPARTSTVTWRTKSWTETVSRWTVTSVPSQRSLIVQAVPRTVAALYRPLVRYLPCALEWSVWSTEVEAANAPNVEVSAAFALHDEYDGAPGNALSSSESVVRP